MPHLTFLRDDLNEAETGDVAADERRPATETLAAFALEAALSPAQRRRIAALRGAAMERAVGEVGAVFVAHEQELLHGALKDDLLELCHPDLDWGVKAAKTLARERIFQNERKAKLEIGAYTTLGILLDCQSVRCQGHGPFADCHGALESTRTTRIIGRHARRLDVCWFVPIRAFGQ